MRVTKYTLIAEALEMHPEARGVFAKYGLEHILTMGALTETIEAIARINDVNPQRIVKDLNNLLRNK